ncbi:hypothetical protein DACRYDRAFT_23484 [Dacryopinax primogenitus]|uniref:Integral membrane protein n=1 Tax=Dacryopinax primogenitus (strain DJM 731) TaxID=1858805 RepID=M5G862_DACPD|nr:uncharacterized protein DACRYDRAFT_23484 [Dacryopinax primogenitus]EJT99947.1 hypothetical protein DACRYDRAFT_23484 [Dacryopinax primogenitus]
MRKLLLSFGLLAAVVKGAWAYIEPISDTDDLHQVCSGMWAGGDAHIQASFDPGSHGQLAMVIYEWGDIGYLGKITSPNDPSLPKTYVCTSDAVNAGFCATQNLGEFIVNLPSGMSINQTSVWTASLYFSNSTRGAIPSSPNEGAQPNKTSSDLWIPPDGSLPKIPSGDTEHSSPFRSRAVLNQERGLESRQNRIRYTQPIQYPIKRKGYYCVGTIPITLITNPSTPKTADHANFTGTVLFANVFSGLLPASEYPKIWFYLAMTWAYTFVGAIWGWLCYKHRQDLLALQYYIASLIGLLVIEMLASWGYYRYLNAHTSGITSTAFLIVVAILDAGRNSLSFFLLLVVSLGLTVTRESLGKLMLRAVILGSLHFVFGVVYAVGTVEVTLETASIFLLLTFVVPLAFTLSIFLLWIMYALNGTIQELASRKQRYKLSMFTRLYRILLGAVVIMAIFFVVSSLSFSNRLAEDYASNSWSTRWLLLDGWLALLYLTVFCLIAYIWRPTDNNRYLANVDEIAQDADDYDLEGLERNGHVKPSDSTDNLGHPESPGTAQDVVFEIGEEEDEDERTGGLRSGPARVRTEVDERAQGGEEAQGLMGARGKDD